MPIYEFSNDQIRQLNMTTFSEAQMQERRDLQRLLRANISVIAPDTLVIAEEFGEWDESRRRIDLLGVDRDANLVVIELKRTEDGGHMELQAIRYAAMVSAMTFEQAVGFFGRYLAENGRGETDAKTELLDFLDWDEPNEDEFAQDVRIVLASAEFGRELTTSVIWLRDRDIDISCVRLQPYSLEGKLLVDVQQIIPLPEVAAYQIQVSEKKRKERESRTDWTSYDLVLGDQRLDRLRKRQAIFHMFRHIVESGVSPEKVAENCGRRANRALISVEGEVSADEFVELAIEDFARENRNFDARRFFVAEGDLFISSGRTYAFSNQWGGPDWEQAMKSLRDAYPDLRMNFTPSE